MTDAFVYAAKLLPYLLYPLNAALWLALLGLLLGVAGRPRLALVPLGVATIGLWLVSTPVVAERWLASLESRYPPLAVTDTPRAGAIVLLGGALYGAAPPRLWPDLGGGADRLVHAARLYRAGKAPVIIVSGGNVFPGEYPRPEAEGIRELLVEWGLEAADIVLETASRNTRDNAVHTRALLESRGIERVLLVTSAWHMPRAAGAFRAAGVDVIPAPTDFLVAHSAAPPVFDWIPDISALSFAHLALHESLGMLVYRWRGWLAP